MDPTDAQIQPAEYSPEQHAAGEALFSRHWQFVKSVPSLEFLPPADRREIAFAGRSNVGKSSLFNALVKHRGLARTSNTPGRTQELNYFELPGVSLYLVDMPGYGFAKAPKANVEAWTRLVKDYLRGRPNLLRVFLLIDSRHGLKHTDLAPMELMNEAGVSYQVVLTKIDKIKPHQLERVLAETNEALAKHAAAYVTVLTTSSEKGLGFEDMRAEIATLATAHGVRL